MTIAELRDIAEGLANRATRAAEGEQDTLDRGSLALEKLYDYAERYVADNGRIVARRC